MNKPQLIAETPRAGKWNHRFIAAKDGKLSDSDIAKIIAAARRNPQGDDYISVSVETAQALSGRTGKEILVLTGIDVKKLSESKRKEIVEQLEQRLKNDLDKLVTETIDWDKDGEAILLKRQELDEWEKDFSNLPPPIEKKLPKPKNKPKKLNMGLVAGGVGVLLVLGLVVWQMGFLPSSKSTTDTTNGNQTTNETSGKSDNETNEPKDCIKTVFNNNIKDKIEELFSEKHSLIECKTPNKTITDFNDFIKEACKLNYFNEDNKIEFISGSNQEFQANKTEVENLKQEFEKCYNLKKEQNAK